MIMAESAVVAQMRTLISSSDPAGAYVELSIVDVPGLGSRPAHQVIKAKCTFCDASKNWSSWARIRGHLSGDFGMAMSLGAAKCMHVQEDVATRSMKIIQDSIDLSKRRSAIRRSETAVNLAVETASLPSASKQQRSIESAFSAQNRDVIDQAVANCIYAKDLAFAITGSVTRGRSARTPRTSRWDGPRAGHGKQRPEAVPRC